MKRILVFAGLVLLVSAVGASAQNSGDGQQNGTPNGPFTYMYQYVLQQDADGDGIPNGQDEDWEGVKAKSEELQPRYSWVHRVAIMIKTRANATVEEFGEFLRRLRGGATDSE